jgi:homoserine acetyltransferase
MISATEYTKLKDAAEKASIAAQRAEGAFEQALKELKKDFEVEDLDAAKAKLVELKQEEADALAKFEAKFEKFKEDYGHILDKKQA